MLARLAAVRTLYRLALNRLTLDAHGVLVTNTGLTVTCPSLAQLFGFSIRSNTGTGVNTYVMYCVEQCGTMRTETTFLSVVTGCHCLVCRVVSVIACRLYGWTTGHVHFVAWTLVLTEPIGSISPINTDSFIRTFSGISLQTAAAVFVKIASVKDT